MQNGMSTLEICGVLWCVLCRKLVNPSKPHGTAGLALDRQSGMQ